MPLEFACNSCQRLLRVPDDAAGKQTKCPNCGAIQEVPSDPDASSSQPWSFGESMENGESHAQNPRPAVGDLNPYASPAPLHAEPKPSAEYGLPITNHHPTIDEILGHAWQVWQQNLGLLVGVTVAVIGISWGIALPLGFAQGILEAQGEEGLSAVVGGIGNIVAQAVQIFLGIGQTQIALKLARGKPAEFGDLFAGGPRFLPVLGISILAGIAVFLGMLACIIPGIFLALMLWPAYYLVVDDRSKVFDSFSLAQQITDGNKLTTFALAMIGVGINLLGFLALCIGVIFSAPLVVMIFATAYLMMSGQLFPGGATHLAPYPK